MRRTSLLRMMFATLVSVTSAKAMAGDTLLDADFAKGRSLESEALLLTGDLGEKAETAEDHWRASFSQSKSQQVDPASANPTVDQTDTISAGISRSPRTRLGGSLGLAYGRTAQEQLSTTAVDAAIFRTWRWGTKDDSSLRVQDHLFYTRYAQTASETKTVRRTQVKTNTSASIDQTHEALDLSYSPVTPFNISLDVSFYFYNQSVAAFLNRLESPAAVARGISGFSSTVYGLPQRSYDLDLTWDLSDNWTVEAGQLIAWSAADGSFSTESRFELSDQLTESFRVTAGYAREQSPFVTDDVLKVGCEITF